MEWVVLVVGAGLVAAVPAAAVAGRWARRRGAHELVVPGFPEALAAHRTDEPGAPILVATGDPSLDGAVTLRGDVGRWLLAATPEVRAGLRRLLPLGLELRDGRMRGPVAAEDRAAIEGAVVRLRDAFAAAPSTIVARFETEPAAPVRRRLLEWALGGPERADVLVRAAADPDLAVRLRRAEETDDVGALVTLTVDPAAAPALRDLAFTALRRRIGADAVAEQLLAIDGPEAPLARERLTSLPPGPWVDALVERLRERAEAEDVVPTLLSLLHALPESEGRARMRPVLAGLPEAAARALIPRIPARLLSREVVAETERARPSIGILLRSTYAVRHTDTSGPDLRDAAALYDGTALRWSPEARRAAGHRGLRYLSATPGVGGTLFRLTPVPMAARLVMEVRAGGERSSEVPGTAPALSWFPRHVQELLRDHLPPCDALQVEDGEVRLRATPESREDVERVVAFLERLADALDALGPLTEAQRVTAAFRTAERGAVRRKLAAWSFAAHAELAAAFLDDDDPDVRRAAGRHAPHPPTLVALVADRALPLPLRSVALTDLQSLDDREALSAAVTHAWDEEGLVPQAIVATGAARLRDQWGELVRLVDRLAPPAGPARLLDQELVRRALHVLCALEEPASEGTVLRATLSRDPALRRAAIGALGAIGSPPMLRALQACAEHHPADRAAVDRAVARLRARVGTGTLAVAEIPGGGLSEPSGGGALAVPGEPGEPRGDVSEGG